MFVSITDRSLSRAILDVETKHGAKDIDLWFSKDLMIRK